MSNKARSTSTKKPSKPPGAWLSIFLIESEAFKTLNGATKQILLEFLLKREIEEIGSSKKRTAKRIHNNGRIELPYSETGYNRHTTSAAIKTLVERGFISVAEPGGLRDGRNINAKYSVHILDAIHDKDAAWHTWRAPVKPPSPGIEKRTRNLVQFRKKRQCTISEPSGVLNRTGSKPSGVPNRTGKKKDLEAINSEQDKLSVAQIRAQAMNQRPGVLNRTVKS